MTPKSPVGVHPVIAYLGNIVMSAGAFLFKRVEEVLIKKPPPLRGLNKREHQFKRWP